MPRALRTAAANDDLRGIAFHIGVDSGRPALADAIIDELIDCCDQLATLSPASRLGTPVPRLGIDVRLFTCKRWVIIFRYVDDGILVLRIADGSQDYFSWQFD
jgi:plasmid stabilization system protein ParE